MNIEKMRKDFETWTANHDYLGGVEVDIAISGNYSDVDMQHAWEAWQASRESLVIELPTCEYANEASEYSKGHRQGIRACRDSIHAAGVKTK